MGFCPGAGCAKLPNAACDANMGCLAPGNFNDDEFINLADWLDYSDCMDGPNVAAPSGCDPAQLDVDNDVDLRDSAAFLNFYTAGG